jgi:hypothetical protein
MHAKPALAVPAFGKLLASAPDLSDLPPRDQTPLRVPEFWGVVRAQARCQHAVPLNTGGGVHI